jgi:hypothetical protein
MAIASKGDRRKGDIEKIKIEEEGSKDQELTVHHEAVLPKKKRAQCGAGMKNLQQNGARLL